MIHKGDKLSDTQLISLIEKGNELAFNELYESYWPLLFPYCLNILHDAAATEDVLHEVFVNLWVNRKKSKIKSARAYLFIATRNKAISYLRRVKLTDLDKEIIENLTLPPQVEEEFAGLDLNKKIKDAVGQLPQRCKDIFFMSRYDEYSNAEIADHFNISQRTVENQLHRALKHLRQSLSNFFFFF